MARLHGRGLDIFEGTGGFGRRRRGPGAVTLVVSIVVVLALVGAAGWVLFRRLNPDNTVPLVVLGIAGPDGQFLRLGGAVVTGPDGKTATTGEDGTATLGFTAPADLTVTAAGYQDATFRVEAVPPDGELGLQLDPLVLKGRVTDPQGSGVVAATVQVGEQQTTTDELGSFELVAAVPGPVEVAKMAWETASAEWDGSAERFAVTLEPFIVKGVRVYGVTAGSSTDFNHLLEMIDGTAVNTLVFDTKEEGGAVLYDSQVPEARSTGAVINSYDVEEVLAAAEEQRPVHHHPHRHLPGQLLGAGQPGARGAQHRHR